MNTNEAARIAAAVNILRPDWPTSSLTTFVNDKLGYRPFHDAARALVWVATDGETKTPARVLTDGPWWKYGSDDNEPIRTKRHDHCGQWHRPTDPCPGPATVSRQHSDHAKAVKAQIRRANHLSEPTVRPMEDTELPAKEAL